MTLKRFSLSHIKILFIFPFISKFQQKILFQQHFYLEFILFRHFCFKLHILQRTRFFSFYFYSPKKAIFLKCCQFYLISGERMRVLSNRRRFTMNEKLWKIFNCTAKNTFLCLTIFCSSHSFENFQTPKNFFSVFLRVELT